MLVPLFLLMAAATSPASQFQARMQEGVAALDENKLIKAQASFEQAARLAPKQADPWLLLAETYAKRKNVPAARAAARKAETLGAEDPRILQGLANFYAKLVVDLPKAAKFGERYAEKSPRDTTAWKRLTGFCIESGLPRQAVAAGHRAVAANPYDEEAQFQLAQAYLVQQDFASAITVLQSARKIFDKSAQIELALGVAYYGARKFPEAVDQFLRTMKLAPDVPQPYLFLGRMLDQVGGRLPEVTNHFAQFQARNPDNSSGYLLYAKALLAETPPQFDQAFQLLQKSVALKEDVAEAHYELGVVLDERKEYPAAATHLERCIQLNPNDSAAHFRLARVYDRLGRKDDAAKQRVIHEKLSEQGKPK